MLLDCCHLLIMRSRRSKDYINNFAHLLIDTDDINTGAKVYRVVHPYLSF